MRPTWPVVLMPAAIAARIRGGGRWGGVVGKTSQPEQVSAISGVGTDDGAIIGESLPKYHWLDVADPIRYGQWYRVGADLHAMWHACMVRADAGMSRADFKAQIPRKFYSGEHIAVTYAPDAPTAYPGLPLPEFAAWRVGRDQVHPIAVEVEPAVLGTAALSALWPVDKLADTVVTIVGAGSIGGAAAVDLATYGIGRLLLVDPDRLLWHNLVRHVSAARDVGRMKTHALQREIEQLRPDTTVEAHPFDVVTHTDDLFALLRRSDAVLCAADGVAARRVVSHLARRARIDAILACVLEDGAVGEIHRLRPWPGRGCLLCHRRILHDTGAVDPEPAVDAGYGTGTTHRPMTAVGGDLHLVGLLAAKVTVASVLERRGEQDQQLPGEHAVIGLRPAGPRLPPFDVRSAVVSWSSAWPPQPDCPTCGP